MTRRKKKVNEQQIINSIINDAVGRGLDAIVERHPRFKENQDYILRHIDKKRLNEKVSEIYEDVRERSWSDEKKLEYMHNELTDYVATGAAFDEAGKEIILRKGLEEKAGRWWAFGARRRLDGEKYLDHTIEAFQELYSLFKTGQYAERMPEVADAVSTVYELGFLDPAVDILKHYGMIDKRKHEVLKRSIREKTVESAQRAVSGIEKYATYQKAASIISILIGIFFILNSFSGMTGFVIAESVGKGISGILGLVLIIGGVLVFMSGRRSLQDIIDERTGVTHKESKKYKELVDYYEKEKKGVRKMDEVPEEQITFEEYEKFLNNKFYEDFKIDTPGAYKSDRGEYVGIFSNSKKNSYLNERVKEINRDIDRVKEIKEMMEKKESGKDLNDIDIQISVKALDRAKNDAYIKSVKDKYLDEIQRISQLPRSRPAETIGDFKISPRGHKKIRVAWHYKEKPETIYIDDLLYHINKKDYVNKWNEKAESGKVNLKTYNPHKKFTGAL